MKLKIFIYTILVASLTWLGIWSAFAAVNYFTNKNIGEELQEGLFKYDNESIAGLVNFDNAGRENFEIKWKIHIQAIGSENSFKNARLQPPVGKNPARFCWDFQNWSVIWTQNAGDILLSGNGTDLKYNPVTNQLEGYGYNKNLGRIYLGSEEYCNNNNDDEITDEEVKEIKNPSNSDDSKLAKNSASFIGRVKVIGNIGANNTIFGAIYDQDKWVNYAQFSRQLNQIRENIALRSRNISADLKNDFSTSVSNAKKFGDMIFYLNNENSLKTVDVDSIPNDIRSIVIVGGDVVITSENISGKSNAPRAIVVLQNSYNVWWNIYIKNNVKNIYSSLIAEKSILSGEWEGKLYNDTSGKIADLPKNQLYIHGLVASRNTIGGASHSSASVKCPYNSVNCTETTAQIFDFNYFRNFDRRNDGTRAYNGSPDEYSMIIEYDANILKNPPSALEVVR